MADIFFSFSLQSQVAFGAFSFCYGFVLAFTAGICLVDEYNPSLFPMGNRFGFFVFSAIFILNINACMIATGIFSVTAQ